MSDKKVSNEANLIAFIRSTQQKAKIGRATKAEERIGLAKSFAFLGVFSCFTTLNAEEFLMLKPLVKNLPLQIFLFPAIGALEIAETTAAGIALGTADNKNMEKMINFISKVIPTSIILSAISTGVAAWYLHSAALTAVVPPLFAIALGISTAFDFVQAIYHAKKMYDADLESHIRQAHKQQLIKFAIGTTIKTMILVAVIALLVLHVTQPWALALFAGIGIATVLAGIALFIVPKIMAYVEKTKKTDTKEADNTILAPKDEKPSLPFNQAIMNVLGGSESSNDIDEATKASGTPGDYLYIRNLTTLLEAAKKKDTEEKQESQLLKKTFIKIINEKINNLDQQTEDDQPNLNKKINFFHRLTPNQEKKREAKTKGLEALKRKIEGLDKNKKLDATAFDEIVHATWKFNGKAQSFINAGIFQSFWHHKSDVELIFDAAKEYFTKDTDGYANTPACETPTL